MNGKFRVNRFRSSDVDLLLPPPLPLINLPDEVRLARTGVPGQRPMHLVVRRHIATASHMPPEPILRENRLAIETEAADDQSREVLERIHIYEYNQPQVTADAMEQASDALVFDSLFESGNLLRVERVYRQEPSGRRMRPCQEYELLIHPDIKNGAYRQWFYFQVQNGKPGVLYKFAFTNLAKSGALFGHGLQPVVYSEMDAQQKGIGWVHGGSHVRYDVSLAPDAAPGANVLSFQYEFQHEGDCVYFACLQPYTYTDLMEYLEKLENDPMRSIVCRRTELCQSIAQNTCDLLSITSPGRDGIPHDDRRIIVISARVHPGEPNSSWMMKGMLDYLTGPSTGATVLRQHFIFKIVPMLNPDGVINGNTRVSLAGWDLNRKWSNPVEKLFPTIYHLKRQIAQFQSRDRVAIYCDLHGHSLNRNIFTYGCYTTNKKAIKKLSPTSVKNDPRVFPMIVAKNSEFFSFENCDFKVHKSKLNTARVVVNHELGVINSYTLEASFCGPDFGPRKDTQFSTCDLEEMGKSWCQSLLIYFDLFGQVKQLEASRAAEEAIPREISLSVDLATVEHEMLNLELLTSDLLSDCEAAVSQLSTEMENEEQNEMDSDLSGAEEEPIPPTVTREGNTLLVGSTSTPEESPRENTKKVSKRKGSLLKKRNSKRKLKLPKKKKSGKKKTKKKNDPMVNDDNIDPGGPETTNKPSKHFKRRQSKRRGSIRTSADAERTNDFHVDCKKHLVSCNDAVAMERPAVSARGVVLPLMPGSDGVRRLRTAPSSSTDCKIEDTRIIRDSDLEERPVTPVMRQRYSRGRNGSGQLLELPLLVSAHTSSEIATHPHRRGSTIEAAERGDSDGHYPSNSGGCYDEEDSNDEGSCNADNYTDDSDGSLKQSDREMTYSTPF